MQLVNFVNRHLIQSGSATIRALSATCLDSELLVSLVAILLTELDLEKRTTDTGAISLVFDCSLNRTYMQLSSELALLGQHLIGQCSPCVQSVFLDRLGIDLNPGRETWGLVLYPRSLAILVQCLLAKPGDQKEAAVVNIWKRVVETLARKVAGMWVLKFLRILDLRDGKCLG